MAPERTRLEKRVSPVHISREGYPDETNRLLARII